MNRRAFTLIELLVAIGIIAVLTAILFPVLIRPPHHNAPRSSCQSNMKQIGLGFAQYLQDFDERYPPAYVSRVALGTNLGGYAGSLQAYLKSDQLFQCPSEKTDGNNLLIDYGYNEALPGMESKKLNNTASTVLNYELSVPTPAIEAVGELTYGAAPGRNRHLEGSNYLFADGHVKWLKSNKTVGTKSVKPNGNNFTFGVR